MAIDVDERDFTFSGNVGIGVGTKCPSARFDIGSADDNTVGIGNNTPSCRFDVRGDGKVGVKL